MEPAIKKKRISFEERYARNSGRRTIEAVNSSINSRLDAWPSYQPKPTRTRRRVLDDPRTTPRMRALAGLDLQFGAAFPGALLDLPDSVYVQAKTRCMRFYAGYQRQLETCTTRGLPDRDPFGAGGEEEEEERRCVMCVSDAAAICSECSGSLARGTTVEDACARRDGKKPCPTYFTRVSLSCVRDVPHLLVAPYHSLVEPDVWCEACLEVVADEDLDGMRRANRETIKQLCLLNRVDFPPGGILNANPELSVDYPNGTDLADNAYWDESELSATNNLWNPLVDADTHDSTRAARMKAHDEKDRERRRGHRVGVREQLGPVTAARRLFFDPARVAEAAVPLAQQRVQGVFREGYIYDYTLDDDLINRFNPLVWSFFSDARAYGRPRQDVRGRDLER